MLHNNNNKHDGQILLLLQCDALPEYSLELLVYLQGLYLVICWERYMDYQHNFSVLSYSDTVMCSCGVK